MRVINISLKKQFAYGDGLKKEIGLDIAVDLGDDPFRAMRAAESFVDYHDPNFDRIKQRKKLESIIGDPENYTQKEQRLARDELFKLKQIEVQFMPNANNDYINKKSSGPDD